MTQKNPFPTSHDHYFATVAPHRRPRRGGEGWGTKPGAMSFFCGLPSMFVSPPNLHRHFSPRLKLDHPTGKHDQSASPREHATQPPTSSFFSPTLSPLFPQSPHRRTPFPSPPQTNPPPGGKAKKSKKPTHLLVRSLYSTRCPHSLHLIASPKFNDTLHPHSPQLYITEGGACSARPRPPPPPP